MRERPLPFATRLTPQNVIDVDTKHRSILLLHGIINLPLRLVMKRVTPRPDYVNRRP